MTKLLPEEIDFIKKRIALDRKKIKLRNLCLKYNYLRRFFYKQIFAIAYDCFYNEYLWPITSAEENLIIKCEADLQKATNPAKKKVLSAILACYKPLHSHALSSHIVEFAKAIEDVDFKEFVKTMIIDYHEEEKIKATIKSFGKFSDTTTKKVKNQYEQNPYPRWKEPPPVAEIGEPDPSEIDIVIAGCGTGLQAVNFALKYPNARITAIDISHSSLAYAIRQFKELKIGNVTFLCGDILNITQLGQSFDKVICCGVLHHMRDPFAGWNELTKVLKKNGIMQIALYSYIARELIREVQSGILLEAYSDFSLDNVRGLRSHITNLPDGNKMTRFYLYSDFYSVSGIRDLFYHVEEHQFTLPMIKDTIEKLDLQFERFVGCDQVIDHFSSIYPDQKNLSDLDLWDHYEHENQLAFINMYTFLCKKK